MFMSESRERRWIGQHWATVGHAMRTTFCAIRPLARNRPPDLPCRSMQGGGLLDAPADHRKAVCRRNVAMAWTTPTLVEICIGLEINGYLPAEI